MESKKENIKSRRLFDKYLFNYEQVALRYGIRFYDDVSDELLDKGYVCPVTFDYFDNPYYKELSEEHVPQKSIGGNVICLTQKQWNIEFGKIDNYVAERAKELEFQKKTGKSRAVAYVNGKFKCEVTLSINDAKPKLSFVGGGFKESNPTFVDLLRKHENKEQFNVNMILKGQLTRNTKLGYLKNAYLLAFEKFGYSMIFGPKGCIELFNIIRKQLRSPYERILSELPFVFEVNDKSGLDGVYVVNVKGVETIGIFFRLSNSNVNRAGIIFPPVDISISEITKWSTVGEPFDFIEIKSSADFVQFERVISLESARYIDKEY